MRPPNTPTVDAVIVTWNSAPDLPSCLASLPPTVHPIVVDNGSNDDAVVIAENAGATVIALSENRGFPAAANVGFKRVTSDITLLLNPDVIVQEGTIDHCYRVLLGDSSI